MRAWKFQDARQKKKLGESKCPWSVGWIDPDGTRRSKKIGSNSMAEKFRKKIEGQLAAGTYEGYSRKPWADFRKEYEEKIVPGLAVKTRDCIATSLCHFQRIIKPRKVAGIKTSTIDDFVTKRKMEPGRKLGAAVSPATVNHNLRHTKAALRVAHDWGYLPKVPKFRKVREPEHIGPVITPEHFQVIYEACDVAVMPKGLTCEPAEWWRALLLFLLSTGWRIDETLTFRREDLDLETGGIITRAENNKGKRDDMDYLPTVALEHIKRIVGFHALVFSWPHNERTLRNKFHRIQKAAGIRLPCTDARKHKCTAACHLYGFHAIRRGYATLNADSMPAAVLQRKMRHKSFQTTLRYLQLADKMKKATEQVYVPEFLRKRSAN